MKRITKISDLTIGKQYLMISKQFNDAQNNVTCVSDDYSGLNRDIAYFCFTERVLRVPTKQMFVDDMQNNRYKVSVFAEWGFCIAEDGGTELYELEQADYVNTMKITEDIQEEVLDEVEPENPDQQKLAL